MRENLLIAVCRRSNPRFRRSSANSRLISFFLIVFPRAAFRHVLANVCEAKLPICVNSSIEPKEALCFKQHNNDKNTIS